MVLVLHTGVQQQQPGAWVCWQKLQCKLLPLPYIACELCAHPPPFVQMCHGEAPEPLLGLL